MSKKEHWEEKYRREDFEQLSWYEERPKRSLEWIEAEFSKRGDKTGLTSLVDIGAGASTLVDHLLENGHSDLTLLDISSAALVTARQRVADLSNAAKLHWLTTDITTWQPTRDYSIWHDRAVFHFLTTARQRAGYTRALRAATKKGALVIVGTFARGGPEKCSGLPIVQYNPQRLTEELGADFSCFDSVTEEHITPGGKEQLFNWCQFRRL